MTGSWSRRGGTQTLSVPAFLRGSRLGEAGQGLHVAGDVVDHDGVDAGFDQRLRLQLVRGAPHDELAIRVVHRGDDTLQRRQLDGRCRRVGPQRPCVHGEQLHIEVCGRRDRVADREP